MVLSGRMCSAVHVRRFLWQQSFSEKFQCPCSLLHLKERGQLLTDLPAKKWSPPQKNRKRAMGMWAQTSRPVKASENSMRYKRSWRLQVLIKHLVSPIPSPNADSRLARFPSALALSSSWTGAALFQIPACLVRTAEAAKATVAHHPLLNLIASCT